MAVSGEHEQTRLDKEADRANHIRTTMLNVEPVMFAYRYDREIDDLVRTARDVTAGIRFYRRRRGATPLLDRR